VQPPPPKLPAPPPLTEPRDDDAEPAAPLVPRYERQGYGDDHIAARRQWAAERTGARLDHLGGAPVPGERLRGNVENPIGAAQVPLGLAGPLRLLGEHAQGVFYVPLATTEGALVRSYERGMTAITRAGGATARVLRDENRVAPVFVFADVAAATSFARSIPGRVEELRAAAEATTRHGRLLAATPRVTGRDVALELSYATGDASGMNLMARASDAVCRLLFPGSGAERWFIFSGAESEKRPSGSLLAGGKGKHVVAAATLPAPLVRAYLHTTPGAFVALWRSTVLGNLQAGALGYGGQLANGLTALFIACGQDVANVVNAAVGISTFEETPDGSLFASVTLPSLTLGTVGGGTGLGTARECLELLGCAGAGGARKLAEIVAATLLAGELSMGAAIASGEHVKAHEDYGRNRPGAGGTVSALDAAPAAAPAGSDSAAPAGSTTAPLSPGAAPASGRQP
jgi:hydroxymethylglutaryl-CoA reductase (NADPH)